jgi:hypothetical protein
MLSARIMLGDSGDRVNRTSTLVSRIANASVSSMCHRRPFYRASLVGCLSDTDWSPPDDSALDPMSKGSRSAVSRRA